VTEEGSVLGTPDYISPEQAMGKQVDFRSDIYSLGVTLYHMLAKAPPFDGTVSTIMRAHIREKMPSPKAANPNIPDDLCRIIEKMTAKLPGDRYASCDLLFEELEAVRLKEKTGKGHVLDLDRQELVNLLEQEKDKARTAERQLDGFKRQLEKMTRLFYAVLAVAAIGIAVCAFLAIGWIKARQ
jgi:serine/threonine protein kinase